MPDQTNQRMPDESEFPTIFHPLHAAMIDVYAFEMGYPSPDDGRKVYQLARYITYWPKSNQLEREFAKRYARWLLKRHQDELKEQTQQQVAAVAVA